ncbi:MAG: hypothetical protein M3680_32275, partial [Myxococcota bacterium]|nr:hypothetical protein [Myxococcota bacterium]
PGVRGAVARAVVGVLRGAAAGFADARFAGFAFGFAFVRGASFAFARGAGFDFAFRFAGFAFARFAVRAPCVPARFTRPSVFARAIEPNIRHAPAKSTAPARSLAPKMRTADASLHRPFGCGSRLLPSSAPAGITCRPRRSRHGAKRS